MRAKTLAEAIITILLFICCVIFMLVTSGCEVQPYWQLTPQAPVGTEISPMAPGAAPIPIGWQQYVVVGTVNIRQSPDTSSPVVGALYAGALVRADCDRSDNFCEVAGGYVVAACLGVGSGECRAK